MKIFDKKNFVTEWVNKDEYYVVGFDSSNNKKVLAVTITSTAWYQIYFELTDEEYNWRNSNIHALNDLAKRMASDKGNKFYSGRLLLNELISGREST